MDLSSLLLHLLSLTCSVASAAPVEVLQNSDQNQVPLGTNPHLPEGRQNGFVLPIFDLNIAQREQEIMINRKGYLYGSPLLGNTSYFPTGRLGDAMVLRDKQLWFRDVGYITQSVIEHDLPRAAEALAQAGGIRDISSYAMIYQDQWTRTVPDGVGQGVLTNGTQDLYFSMERLSTNPYAVRRLNPLNDTLPFAVDDEIILEIAGLNLPALLLQGRLFYANHSIQASYPTNPGRYTAACSAYFFIHPDSGDFLPLAVKTGVGSDLVYTPLDSDDEWLLAKMAFNMNDLCHGQMFHLATSHDVAEPVHLAALRTLSSRHPVRGYLDRLMYQAYAVRPIGDEALFNPGGFFDQSFALNNVGGRRLAQDLYPIGAGNFRSSEFERDLTDRGLINCQYGPPLKHVPFHEDVLPMSEAIRTFTTTYVESYYPSESYLARDRELQAWVVEANDKAHVLDFPLAPLSRRETLVDILSHIAFLAGIGHHSLNAATPAESSGILPLHPSAFFRPMPTERGEVNDIMPFLHNDTEALKQASMLVRFNRPLAEQQGGNLVSMWSGLEWLSSVNADVVEAAAKFKEDMLRISRKIRAKGFDNNGLSQGMPFIWRSMDPRRIPYYLSV